MSDIFENHPHKQVESKSKLDNVKKPNFVRRALMATAGVSILAGALGLSETASQQDIKNAQALESQSNAQAAEMFKPTGYSSKDFKISLNDLKEAKTVDNLAEQIKNGNFNNLDITQISSFHNIPISETQSVRLDKPYETDLSKRGLGENIIGSIGLKDGTTLNIILPTNNLQVLRDGQDNLALPATNEEADKLDKASQSVTNFVDKVRTIL